MPCYSSLAVASFLRFWFVSFSFSFLSFFFLFLGYRFDDFSPVPFNSWWVVFVLLSAIFCSHRTSDPSPNTGDMNRWKLHRNIKPHSSNSCSRATLEGEVVELYKTYWRDRGGLELGGLSCLPPHGLRVLPGERSRISISLKTKKQGISSICICLRDGLQLGPPSWVVLIL